jgi:hypothetical protein
MAVDVACFNITFQNWPGQTQASTKKLSGHTVSPTDMNQVLP